MDLARALHNLALAMAIALFCASGAPASAQTQSEADLLAELADPANAAWKRTERALEAYRAALAIHPNKPELREAIATLEAALKGQDI
jgi:hypothetical protein